MESDCNVEALKYLMENVPQDVLVYPSFTEDIEAVIKEGIKDMDLWRQWDSKLKYKVH